MRIVLIKINLKHYQDKISSFWEVKKEEYEKLRAEFRNKDRAMEELEEAHQLELKVNL